MSIGLSLGVLQQTSQAKYKIVISNLSDIQYCSGLTHLTYKVIFNLLKKYDPETLSGSKMTDLIGKANFNSQDLTSIQAEMAEDILDLENRMKFIDQSYGTLSRDTMLGRIELLAVTLDKVANGVIISIKVINIEGLTAFVEVT